MKRSVAEPRFGWGGETHHSVGSIIDIESNGRLIIEIANRAVPWEADPSDMEKLEDFKVDLHIELCRHLISLKKHTWIVTIACNMYFFPLFEKNPGW